MMISTELPVVLNAGVIFFCVLLIGCGLACFKSSFGRGCCHKNSSGDSDSGNDGKEEEGDVVPSVLLHQETRASGRANTWPWNNVKPLRGQSHGRMQDDRENSIIFNSNSMCLQVIKDGEEPFFPHPCQLLIKDGAKAQVLNADGTSMHSVISDFEEEVMRSVEALVFEPAVTDSLQNVKGSLESCLANCSFTSSGESGSDEMPDSPDDGDAGRDDIKVIISDEDTKEVSIRRSLLPREGNVNPWAVGSSSLLTNKLGSLLRYRCSMAKEEMHYRSSTTSSLELETSWISNLTADDLPWRSRPHTPSGFVQEQCRRSPHPYMLYRYSISLEEIRLPTGSIPGIPRRLPLSWAAAQDEEGDIFYDAWSSLGSVHSSVLNQGGSILRLPEDDQLLTVLLQKAHKSMTLSRKPKTSSPGFRRCNSLHVL
ncbi:uncharacterized protein [Diadema antillarum]|uniref:uncharacterized protein n=1 Tax=Diadema antillarum TaxID=105358 RepID=UPI003A8740FC